MNKTLTHRMTPREQFAWLIKSHRWSWSMSQAELAKRAGVTQGTIARFEAARGNPTLATVTGIAKALNLELVLVFERPVKQIRELAN